VIQHAFTFFLRLLFGFLAAKLLTRHFELAGLGYLLGITLFFVANVYFFEYLDYRGHALFRRKLARRREDPSTAPPPPSPDMPPEA
jgi:hypothetical protein